MELWLQQERVETGIETIDYWEVWSPEMMESPPSLSGEEQDDIPTTPWRET